MRSMKKERDCVCVYHFGMGVGCCILGVSFGTAIVAFLTLSDVQALLNHLRFGRQCQNATIDGMSFCCYMW